MSNIITGIKPTGRLHLGNYFSVIKPLLDLQKNAEKNGDTIFVFLADLHAYTDSNIQKDFREYNRLLRHMAIDLLSLGLDPKKVVFFRHSDFPQITELSWFFSCLLSLSYIQRAHAYKAKKSSNENINIGTLTYPILMAADILINDIDFVLVGQDQFQHIEIARDIAKKFNHQYGEMFVEPQAYKQESEELVIGIDGRKMSKSYNNTINIFADKDEIIKKTMQIKTDSLPKGSKLDPEKCNVFAIYKLFGGNDVEKLREQYLNGSIGYKEAKELLAEKICSYFEEANNKRDKLILETDIEETVFNKNKELLNKNFDNVLEKVKEKIGILYKDTKGDSGVLQ